MKSEKGRFDLNFSLYKEVLGSKGRNGGWGSGLSSEPSPQ